MRKRQKKKLLKKTLSKMRIIASRMLSDERSTKITVTDEQYDWLLHKIGG